MYKAFPALSIPRRLLVCQITIALSLLCGCNDQSVDVETFLPKPEWVDSVKAPVLFSVDEVKELWSSKKRCCINKRKLKNNQREFYKACYLAVASNAGNQELVTKCLQLMDSGMDVSVRRKINEHFVNEYFDFDSPVDRCVNCLPGDPIANASRDLAWIEFRINNASKAIQIIQRVLDARTEEISPFVQMNLYAALAHFYASAGYSQDDLSALKVARDRLRPHVKAKGASKYNFKEFERYLVKLLED